MKVRSLALAAVAVWMISNAAAQETGEAASAGACVDPTPGAGLCRSESALVESALRLQSLTADAGAMVQSGGSGLAGALSAMLSNENRNASSGGFMSGLGTTAIRSATPLSQSVAEPRSETAAERAAREKAAQERQERARDARVLRLCPTAATELDGCIARGRADLQGMRVAVQVAERELQMLSALDPATLDAPTRARLRTTVQWVSESLRRAVALEENVTFLEAEQARRAGAASATMSGLMSSMAPVQRSPQPAAAPKPFAMAALDAASAFLTKIADVAIGRANAAAPAPGAAKKD